MLDAARRGRVDAVLVSRLDRSGRSSLELLPNIRALTKLGVEFICIEQEPHVRPDQHRARLPDCSLPVGCVEVAQVR